MAMEQGEQPQWEYIPDTMDIGHGKEVPESPQALEKPIEFKPAQPAAAAQQAAVGPTYLPDDQLKDKVVKLRTTDPETGDTIEEETDAITAQSLIKGNIDTYTMLIDCLQRS
jgi:hypothetical protein